MKREKPILFSSPMVLAILEGRKTQTRRVASIIWDTSKHWGDYDCWTFQHRGKPCIGFSTDNRGHETLTGFCPYGQPGDQMWVKETFRVSSAYDHCSAKDRHIHNVGYRAGGGFEFHPGEEGRWRSSRFMPQWASRITLEIVAVRVERLQDISDEDAIAEGIERGHEAMGWKDYSGAGGIFAPIPSYASLWESINGPGSWEKNPWVWVVEFKRL